MYPKKSKKDVKILNSRETKAFMDLWNKVGYENEEAWASKVDKYVDEGMTEKEAKKQPKN